MDTLFHCKVLLLDSIDLCIYIVVFQTLDLEIYSLSILFLYLDVVNIKSIQ